MPSGKKGIVSVIKKRQLSIGVYKNFKVGAGESPIQKYLILKRINFLPHRTSSIPVLIGTYDIMGKCSDSFSPSGAHGGGREGLGKDG